MRTEKFDMKKFEEVTFPLVKMAVATRVNLGSLATSKMRLDTWRDYATDSLVMHLSTYLISNKVHEDTVMRDKYPATWIEAFKERYWRFIPESLRYKFPIKYTWVPLKIDHIHICPHCDHVPWGDGLHISFMTTDDEDYHSSASKASEKQ